MIRLPAVAAGALACLLLAATASQTAAAERDQRPNVVVIVTDDQPVGSFQPRFMPETFKRFVNKGTVFDQSVVATPLCCPSRAALLTGQYGHNNGVLLNQYSRLRQKKNVLPAWLSQAGYKTMHVGRFFNGYGFVGRKAEVAPGWRLWRTAVEPHSYYDYRMRFNHRFRSYGSADRAYVTSTFNRLAAGLVRRHAGPSRRPFYLQVDHFAPHVGSPSRTKRCGGNAAVPGPEDELAYSKEPIPEGPAYNEADLSDKPAFLRDLPTIDDPGPLTASWQCQLASLREVDRGIGDLWRALRERGVLRDTAVIFTSDNGFHYGEHRLQLDKHYPYEESVRVPLAVRLPASKGSRRQPATSSAPVANIDLAPTVLELAEAEPCLPARCRTMDGRSFVAEAAGGSEIPPGRGIALEYDGETPVQGRVCEYQGIRTTSALLVEHIRARSADTGSCEAPADAVEHYDLGSDPFELDNLFPRSQGPGVLAAQAELVSRSRGLADCAGIAGRDPEPPGGNYCE